MQNVCLNGWKAVWQEITASYPAGIIGTTMENGKPPHDAGRKMKNGLLITLIFC